MILDTSFLLDLKDRDKTAFEKGIEIHEQTQRIVPVTVAELYFGVEYTESEEERRRVENLLSMYPVVVPREATARRAGELRARAAREHDRNVGITDSIIGAAADLHGEAVLTDNVTDFEALGVDVGTY
ncbi:nuclease [Halobacteriales archaeon QS_4_69_225]|nr:MAG: nuclease [Halobacteriales archaeon QS_4_69_225]